jgi:RHS repeat-associated protein
VITTTIDGNTTTQTLDFRYDENGYPYELIRTVGETTTTYYYITNLQGDVKHLVDGEGAAVASYTYDPYGDILTATGDLAGINPLRYRGYYYDRESGLYYITSRYYDPEIGRFINADMLVLTGQRFLSNNMFLNQRPRPWEERKCY